MEVDPDPPKRENFFAKAPTPEVSPEAKDEPLVVVEGAEGGDKLEEVSPLIVVVLADEFLLPQADRGG